MPSLVLIVAMAKPPFWMPSFRGNANGSAQSAAR
jgi:hypothetical protein